MRVIRRIAVGLLLLAGAAVVLYVVLVVVFLGIGAYQANRDTSAMRDAISRSLPPGAFVQQTRAFLRTHSIVALPFHRFDVSVETPFERKPAYDPTDGASQVYPQGKALYASGYDSEGQGISLVIVFFFDPKGRLLRYNVDEIWFHAP